MSKTAPKYTACLVHDTDKDRIKDLRTKLNLTEKDTMSMLIDFAEGHMDEMVEKATEINKQTEEAKEARRKEKYEEMKEAHKAARKLIAAGKVKKSDQATDTTEEVAGDEEPSIE